MTGIVSCLRLPVILLVPCVILSCGGVKAAPFTARLTSCVAKRSKTASRSTTCTPRDRFVADFIGEGVFICGNIIDKQTVQTEIGNVNGELAFNLPPGMEIDLLVRPDDIIHDDYSTFRGTVLKKNFRGADHLYTLRMPGGNDAASHGMGVDHTRSTFRFGDHDMRLTDVKGHVVHAARDVCSNEPLAITSTAVAQRQGALGPRNWIS